MSGSIKIRSNIASLNTRRRLGESSSRLQDSFARLSSGLRINSASDDAAGLAISENLGVDSKVFGQGLRNLNDAISLLNIAEGALTELSTILIRQGELSEQAANGTLSLDQRRALNEEANALVEEYNRIVASTEFNDLQLLNLSTDTMRIQAGYGNNGSISFALGSEIARTVGNGTFGTMITRTARVGSNPDYAASADFDGDGFDDVVVNNTTDDTLEVMLSQGDGSFQAPVSYNAGRLYTVTSVTADDINGDGIIDLISASAGDDVVSVHLGVGDGTFKSRTSFSGGNGARVVVTGDFNGDGRNDIAVSSTYEDKVNVLLGNGDGSFQAKISYESGDSYGLAAGDFDGDGVLDLATADYNENTVSVFMGKGDGSFEDRVTLTNTSSPSRLTTGDLNLDGLTDIITSDENDNSVSVFLSTGDGNFGARITYAVGTRPYEITAADFTGDGYLDLVTANYSDSDISVLIGNGDGSFGYKVDYATSTGPEGVTTGDFNGDGAVDIASAQYGDDIVGIFLANATQITTIAPLNLNTRAEALEALDTIETHSARVSQELGALGAVQSRLETAVKHLAQSRENYLAARSRIVDTDVAAEAARLVKTQILQQAGAAVLAQANQTPELALTLLNTS